MTKFGSLNSVTGRFVAVTADVTGENFSRFILPRVGEATTQPKSLLKEIWEVYHFEVWLDDTSGNWKEGVQIALSAVNQDWDKPHQLASGIQMSNQRVKFTGKIQVPYGVKFYIYVNGFVATDVANYTLMYRKVFSE